jgi:tetratricopeptide (TPR) repeat protein
MLSRLGERLDLLTGGAADLPERQRTLRGAIEWSYNLLEPSEQQLLARLGVFAGGCSLEVADAVCADESRAGSVLDALASLVDKSLVRQSDGSDGEPRFGLLESIRAYAVERLEAAGELEPLRRRHAAHCLELVETAEPELTRANQAIWLQRLDEEVDNIRAALAWATSAGEAALALRMAGMLVRFWSTRGLMAEGRRWLADALAAGGDVDPATLALAHFAVGYAALGEGDFAAATTSFERSLETADDRGRGAALAQLAWLAMAAGDARAADLAEQSLGLAEAEGDVLTQSGALGTLGELAAVAGDYGEAASLYQRGLELRRALGDRRLIANSLLGLGRIDLVRGELDQATALLEEGLALARAVKDTWSISVVAANLGRVHLLRDDDAAARDLFVDGLRIARERNDRRVAAELLQGLAAVLAHEGRTADAARLLGAADAQREATGAVPSPAELLVAERFLAPLGLPDFEGDLSAGRRLDLDAAFDLAAAQGRKGAETVVS